ncbi:MAG TPA: type II toxin-antitoxin system VapC family toxin [Thermoanaerobaculia bacterium]|nr:type II toxin-antitoxin system VapC family toxin [Thermoanaerobaculia bacterium]
MIVVDTNIIAHLFIPSDSSGAAERALQKDGDWIVPRLWRSEFRNILATRLRVRKISLENAINTMTKAEDLLRDHEYEISSATVLAVSHRSGASAYDCEFVVLALQFGIPLLTTDRKLAGTFPQTATSIEDWLSTIS